MCCRVANVGDGVGEGSTAKADTTKAPTHPTHRAPGDTRLPTPHSLQQVQVTDVSHPSRVGHWDGAPLPQVGYQVLLTDGWTRKGCERGCECGCVLGGGEWKGRRRNQRIAAGVETEGRRIQLTWVWGRCEAASQPWRCRCRVVGTAHARQCRSACPPRPPRGPGTHHRSPPATSRSLAYVQHRCRKRARRKGGRG